MFRDNKLKVLLVILCLSVMAMAFYSYKNEKDYNQLELIIEQEKQDLQAYLDETIEDYNDAIADKTILSGKLEVELNKIVQLRDSVKNLKKSNYSAIINYRRTIRSLERQNSTLFAKVDSLSSINYLLQKENVSVRKALTTKDSLNTSLAQVNTKLTNTTKDLEERVAKGEIIKTSPVTAIAMKERSNGKLTSTGRSSRADAFRVDFNLLENAVSTAGIRSVYIQIIDGAKNVVASKGTTKLKDGTEITYSDVVNADYKNEQLNLVSLIQVNREDINKGTYTVNTYVDGLFTANTSVQLR